MLSLEDIFIAYYDCRTNKRNTTGALEFELHYETECIHLYNEIVNRQYILRPNTAFIVRDPVKREIFASHFRDRIVHHFLARKLEAYLERVYIHDVYNSRKEKWTHYWISRVEKFLRSASKNCTEDVYILKLDISWFFMSIDKQLLSTKIESIVKRYIPKEEQEVILYLTKIILFSDVKENVIIYGNRTDWIGLPKSKSLFYAKEGKWLPIWNLTSQIFANIYMHEFDMFIKKTLHIQYYWRYVDDFILIHKDKEYLRSCIWEIRLFLQEHLGLTLHPKKIYLQHYKKWVLFLWTYIKPWRIYTGKRTKGNFYNLIQKINIRLIQDDILSEEEIERILSQVNSYLGLMSHTKSYRLRQKVSMLFHEKFTHFFEWNTIFSQISLKKNALK